MKYISRTDIYKSETEQLSNSINWFREEYPDKNATPVVIHPSNVLHKEAFAPKDTVIIYLVIKK
jgi:hypothetical protein